VLDRKVVRAVVRAGDQLVRVEVDQGEAVDAGEVFEEAVGLDVESEAAAYRGTTLNVLRAAAAFRFMLFRASWSATALW